jgi:hypothetical protein
MLAACSAMVLCGISLAAVQAMTNAMNVASFMTNAAAFASL